MLGIGYFDSPNEAPAHDEAKTCVVCGQPFGSRATRAIVIHCERWPLGTFVRFHADEADAITTPVFQELVCLMLEARAQMEQSHQEIPSSFLKAFGEG